MLEQDKLIASAEKDDVRVDFIYIGEGLSGDYNPDNPEDEPLLRFYVYHNEEPVDDASYCTTIRADADPAEVQKAADTVLEKVYEPIKNGKSVKKICETLSWL